MDEVYLNLYALILLMWLAYETSWKFFSKWFSRIAKLFSFLILVFLSGLLLLEAMLEKSLSWNATNYTLLCLFFLCISFIINLYLPHNTKT